MLPRFYFDTSVFGGIFDVEFEEDTLQLFEQVKLGKIIYVYSDLTESELIDAPFGLGNILIICLEIIAKESRWMMIC